MYLRIFLGIENFVANIDVRLCKGFFIYTDPNALIAQ